jgi:deoxyribodipyrimidine photo-lyase
MELKPIDTNQAVLQIIERDFQGLFSGELGVSSITGGQSAANRALDQLDITRYAEDRSQVLPELKSALFLKPDGCVTGLAHLHFISCLGPISRS